MPSAPHFRIALRAALAALALAMILLGARQLSSTGDGLVIRQQRLGNIPVTIHTLPGQPRAPAVVIAHGFAGSQQLMQPFARTLAHAGYVAVSFDFPGHGRNADALGGGLANQEQMTQSLLDALTAVIRLAKSLPEADAQVALLGHSMASDIVVRAGMADPAIAATIAVSLFFPGPTADAPRNLLIIDGALEGRMLHDEGLKLVALASPAIPQPGTTYGRFEDGTARRLALARGVEHIGVLYAQDSLDEALQWLAQVFERQHADGGWRDRRGNALALLFGGIAVLAWPLSTLLPRLSSPAQGAGLSRRQLLLVAGLPALLTPLLLWKLPMGLLPLLLGDYLAVHFAVCGLLMGGLLLWTQAGRGLPMPPLTVTAAVCVLLVVGYCALAFGLPLDRWVSSVAPMPSRLPLIAAMFLGLLPFFVVDEWITRGASSPRGAYALTKTCLLLSLLLAVALNLEALFFLIIIVPVILLLFGVFGLFSRWVWNATGQPLIAAFANALVFAWLIAVSFPVIAS